jgi:hypothetical protein
MVLGLNASNLRPFFTNGQLYLGRFLLSYTSISNQEYKSNLLDEPKLLELIKGVAKEHRASLALQNWSKSRCSNKLKLSKQVKLTNLDTKEVLFFDSRHDTVKYLNELNLGFKCSAGSVSDCIRKGRVYKKIFKLDDVI